ncbi:hypothetical protein H311_00671 [Anncaliia algerae PRA109]|nr:hypothetical protein H311_00671 [Anncaliia algerae PRA109]
MKKRIIKMVIFIFIVIISGVIIYFIRNRKKPEASSKPELFSLYSKLNNKSGIMNYLKDYTVSLQTVFCESFKSEYLKKSDTCDFPSDEMIQHIESYLKEQLQSFINETDTETTDDERYKIICSYFDDYINNKNKDKIQEETANILKELNAEEMINYFLYLFKQEKGSENDSEVISIAV